VYKRAIVKLGYNEHSVITREFFSPKWSFYFINQLGYNKQIKPELFVMTEFDCTCKISIKLTHGIDLIKIRSRKRDEKLFMVHGVW